MSGQPETSRDRSAMNIVKQSLEKNSKVIHEKLPFKSAKEKCDTLFQTIDSGERDFSKLLKEEREWEKEKAKITSSVKLASKHEDDITELKEDLQALHDVTCAVGEAVDELQRARIEQLSVTNQQQQIVTVPNPLIQPGYSQDIPQPVQMINTPSHVLQPGYSQDIPQVNTLLKELNEKLSQERIAKETLQSNVKEMRIRLHEMTRKVSTQADQIAEQHATIAQVNDTMNSLRATSEKAKQMEREITSELKIAEVTTRDLNNQIKLIENHARMKEESYMKSTLECDRIMTEKRKLLVEMKALQDEITALQKTIATYECKLKELSGAFQKIKDLENQLETTKSNLTKSQNTLISVHEGKDKLESKLRESEGSLTRSEETRCKQSKEILKLTTTINEAAVATIKYNSEYNNRIAVLKGDIRYHQDAIVDLKKRLECANNESKIAKEQLRITREEMRKLQKTSDGAKRDLKKYKAETQSVIEGKDKNIDVLEKKIETLEKKIVTHTVSVKEYTAEIESLNGEIKWLKTKGKITEESNEHSLQRSLQKCKELEHEKEYKFISVIREKDEKISYLQKDLRMCEQLLKESAAEIENLREEISTTNEKLNTIDCMRKKHSEDIERKSRIDEADYKHELNQKHKRINELKNELSRYSDLVTSNNNEIASLRTNLKDMAKDMEAVKENAKMTKSESMKLQQKSNDHLSKLRVELEKYKVLADMKEIKIQHLEKESASYKTLVEGNKSEIATLHGRLKEQENELHKERQKLNRIKNENGILRGNSVEREDTENRWKHMLEEKKEEIECQEKKIKKYESILEENQQQLNMLREELEFMKCELKTTNRKHEEENQQLRRMSEAKLLDLQQEYTRKLARATSKKDETATLLVTELQNQLSESQFRLDITTKELKQVKSTRSQKEMSCSYSQTDFQSFHTKQKHNEVTRLKEELEEADHEIVQLKGKIKNTSNVFESKGPLKRHDTELQRIREELDKTINRLDDFGSSRHRHEFSSMQCSYDDSSVTKDLETKITKLQVELNRTLRELENVNSISLEKDQVLYRLHVELEDAQLKLHSKTKEIKVHEVTLDDKAEALREATKEMGEIKRAMHLQTTLAQEVNDYFKANHDMEVTLKQLRIDYDKATEKLAFVTDDLYKERGRYDAASKGLSSYQDKIKELQDELKNTTVEYEKLKKLSSKKSDELFMVQGELEKTLQELKKRNKEIKIADEALKEKSDAFDQVSKDLISVQFELREELCELKAATKKIPGKKYKEGDLDQTEATLKLQETALLQEQWEKAQKQLQDDLEKTKDELLFTTEQLNNKNDLQTIAERNYEKLQTEMENTKAELTIMSQQLLHKDIQQKGLEKTNQQLEGQLEKLNKHFQEGYTMAELELTQNKLKTTEFKKHEALNALKNELAGTYEQLQMKTEDLQLAEDKIESTTEALCQASKDLVEIQNDLQGKLVNTEKELQLTKQQLDNEEQNRESVETDLGNSLKELAAVKQKHELQKVALEQLSEELEDTWEELKGKNSQLQLAQDCIEQKQEALKKVNKDFAASKEAMENELYIAKRDLVAAHKEVESKNSLQKQLEATLQEVSDIKVTTTELSTELEDMKKDLNDTLGKNTVGLGGYVWIHVGILDKCVKELAKVQGNVKKSHESLVNSQTNLILTTEGEVPKEGDKKRRRAPRLRREESLIEKVMKSVDVNSFTSSLNKIPEMHEVVKQHTLQDDLETTKKELEELKQSVVNKKLDLAKVQTELEFTAQELKSRTEFDIISRLENAISVKDRLQDKIEVAHSQWEVTQTDEEIKRKLTRQLTEVTAELENSKIDAAEQSEIVESMKRELENSRKLSRKKSAGKTKDALMTSIRELEKVQDELDQTRTELHKTSEERDSIMESYNTLQGDYTREQALLKSIHAELEHLKEKSDYNSTDLERTLSNEIVMKEKEQKHMEKRIQHLEALVSTLQSTNNELTKKLQLKEKEYAECIQKLQEEKEKLKEKCGRRKSEISEMRHKLIEFQSMIDHQESLIEGGQSKSFVSARDKLQGKSIDHVLMEKKRALPQSTLRRHQTEPSSLKKSLINSLNKNKEDGNHSYDADNSFSAESSNTEPDHVNIQDSFRQRTSMKSVKDKTVRSIPSVKADSNPKESGSKTPNSMYTSSSEESDNPQIKAAVDAIMDDSYRSITAEHNASASFPNWASATSSDSDDSFKDKKKKQHQRVSTISAVDSGLSNNSTYGSTRSLRHQTIDVDRASSSIPTERQQSANGGTDYETMQRSQHITDRSLVERHRTDSSQQRVPSQITDGMSRMDTDQTSEPDTESIQRSYHQDSVHTKSKHNNDRPMNPALSRNMSTKNDTSSTSSILRKTRTDSDSSTTGQDTSRISRRNVRYSLEKNRKYSATPNYSLSADDPEVGPQRVSRLMRQRTQTIDPAVSSPSAPRFTEEHTTSQSNDADSSKLTNENTTSQGNEREADLPRVFRLVKQGTTSQFSVPDRSSSNVSRNAERYATSQIDKSLESSTSVKAHATSHVPQKDTQQHAIQQARESTVETPQRQHVKRHDTPIPSTGSQRKQTGLSPTRDTDINNAFSTESKRTELETMPKPREHFSRPEIRRTQTLPASQIDDRVSNETKRSRSVSQGSSITTREMSNFDSVRTNDHPRFMQSNHANNDDTNMEETYDDFKPEFESTRRALTVETSSLLPTSSADQGGNRSSDRYANSTLSMGKVQSKITNPVRTVPSARRGSGGEDGNQSFDRYASSTVSLGGVGTKQSTYDRHTPPQSFLPTKEGSMSAKEDDEGSMEK